MEAEYGSFVMRLPKVLFDMLERRATAVGSSIGSYLAIEVCNHYWYEIERVAEDRVKREDGEEPENRNID